MKRFFLLGITLFANSLLAESAPEASGQSYNYFEEFVNMMITLAMLLGLAIITLMVVKKVMRSKLRHAQANVAIKILEKRALNPKASLYLVEILGKAVVISESPQGIQLITEIPAEVNHQAPFEEPEKVSKSQFKELLQSKLGMIFFNGKR